MNEGVPETLAQKSEEQKSLLILVPGDIMTFIEPF
jgi:hypothetical protein